MDGSCTCSDGYTVIIRLCDWSNGLEGFGKEEDKHYLELGRFIDIFGDEGAERPIEIHTDRSRDITIRDESNPIKNPKFYVKEHRRHMRNTHVNKFEFTRSCMLNTKQVSKVFVSLLFPK